jgi:hypothetical protein
MEPETACSHQKNMSDVLRAGRRWAVAALAVGAVVTLTAGQARPHAASGWRIEKTFSGSGYFDAQAIAASGARNAWLLGLVPDPEPFFVVKRWTGRRWAAVPMPARLEPVIGPWELFSDIYTTSPKDTWFFPDLPDGATSAQYALRWNGSAWKISKVTARLDTVLDAAVFSASDVWAFGEAGPSFSSYGRAVVRRWNGTAWRTVTVPVGTPVTVDGVTPDDIWALGVSNATVGPANQVMIAMHWNGKRWSVPRLPAFPPVRKGYPWVATDIWAAGPKDAWVTLTPAINQQTGYSPPGLILLHWNGAAWTTVARSRTLGGVDGLTPDGHDGFWLTATSRANSNATDIVDYRHGTFTSYPAPAPRGYVDSVSGITAIPGTGSFWATGLLTSRKGDNQQTAILRFDP